MFRLTAYSTIAEGNQDELGAKTNGGSAYCSASSACSAMFLQQPRPICPRVDRALLHQLAMTTGQSEDVTSQLRYPLPRCIRLRANGRLALPSPPVTNLTQTHHRWVTTFPRPQALMLISHYKTAPYPKSPQILLTVGSCKTQSKLHTFISPKGQTKA